MAMEGASWSNGPRPSLMSPFMGSSPSTSGQTPHQVGLDQTPSEGYMPNSPDAEEFLQVSFRLSTPTGPPRSTSTERAGHPAQEQIALARTASAPSLRANPSRQPRHSLSPCPYGQPSLVTSSARAPGDPQLLGGELIISHEDFSPPPHHENLIPMANDGSATSFGRYNDDTTSMLDGDFSFLTPNLLHPETNPLPTQETGPIASSLSERGLSSVVAWTGQDPSQASYPFSPVHTSTPSPHFKRELDEASRPKIGSPVRPVGSMAAHRHQDALVPVRTSGQASHPTPDLSEGSRNSSIEFLAAAQTQGSLQRISPMVKVESYRGGGDSLDSAPTTRRDPAHLFPPGDADDVFESDPDPMSNTPPMPPVARAEDGSWMPNVLTGQAGVDPTTRQHLDDVYVPSAKQQEQERQLSERNAQVFQWLVESVVPTEPDDGPASSARSNLQLPTFSIDGRPRARSTGDVRSPPPAPLGLNMGESGSRGSGMPTPDAFVGLDSRHHRNADDGIDDANTITGRAADEASLASPRTGQVDDEEAEDFFASTPDEEPETNHVFRPRPWMDPPSMGGPTKTHLQPASSNAAIMRFRERAENIETASRAATWGTRRMSDTDLDKFIHDGAIFKRLSFGKDKEKPKAKGDKKGFFDELKRRRTKKEGNHLKRKDSERSIPDQGNDAADRQRKESLSSLILSRSASNSSMLQKPHKANSGPTMAAAVAGQIAALGGGGSLSSPADIAALGGSNGQLSTTVESPPTQWKEKAINILSGRRQRSKSELSSLIIGIGGLPVPTLASPPKETETTKPPAGNGDDDDENDDEDLMEAESVEADLTVQPTLINPTLGGFRHHVKQLNPGLEPFLVERVSLEQVRRFNRLIDFREKHLRNVQSGRCHSGKFCFALGGEAHPILKKGAQRELGPSPSELSFPIGAPPGEETDRFLGDGAVASPQFPTGVPLPPVKRLPAEFECPLCFKVRKFQKPSDWTKHVYEDVEPFTCTFSDCTEPRTFRRKADWVRHENERHRQLEWWTCNIEDCNHTCYRKDNFVQHLVREHKMAEPKHKKASLANRAPGTQDKGRTAGSGRADPNQDETDLVWARVDACWHQTRKQPGTEPCKFCNSVHSSWKKLTVHMAQHMQQISLPVLHLVERHFVGDGGPRMGRQSLQQQQQQQPPSVGSMGVSPVSRAEQVGPSTPAMPSHPHNGGVGTAPVPTTLYDSHDPTYITPMPLNHPGISYTAPTEGMYESTVYPPQSQMMRPRPPSGPLGYENAYVKPPNMISHSQGIAGYASGSQQINSSPVNGHVYNTPLYRHSPQQPPEVNQMISTPANLNHYPIYVTDPPSGLPVEAPAAVVHYGNMNGAGPAPASASAHTAGGSGYGRGGTTITTPYMSNQHQAMKYPYRQG